MRTTSTRIGVLGAALFLMNGCGTNGDLDLSELEIADEEKADSASITSEYLWTRPSASQVYCVRAPCESHMIYDVNLDRIQMVYAFDLRALKLPPSDQGRLDGSFSKTLLYGRYGTAKAFGEPVRIFQITRLNPRVSEATVDNPELDRYYWVRAGDPSCQQPPCATFTARLMNRKELPSEPWSGIDLGRLQLGQEAQQRLMEELASGDAYVSALNVSVRPVPITEAFRPLKSAPLP
jgi:hypothetical protein